MNDTVHTKYRPKTLDAIVGHENIVFSLQKVLASKTSRAFLLTGQTGSGKTSIARIIATHFGCTRDNLVEINAATNTGVDAMRDLASTTQFAALGASKSRVYIIDEAHMLSPAAWQSLQKPVEEPPSHVVWIFCTTVAGKIPPTIANRCSSYDLKPLTPENLRRILLRVIKKSKMDVGGDIVDYLAKKSGGSARRALTWLSQAEGITSRKDLEKLISVMGDDNAEIIDLCRELIKGANWSRVTEICKKLKDVNPESVRLVIQAYFTKVLLDCKNEKRASAILDILGVFATPYPSTANVSAVMLSLADLLLD